MALNLKRLKLIILHIFLWQLTHAPNAEHCPSLLATQPSIPAKSAFFYEAKLINVCTRCFVQQAKRAIQIESTHEDMTRPPTNT